jgi:hypothetical protein
MKRIPSVPVFVMFVLAFLATNNGYAGNWLNKKEVHQLLTGNTVNGFYMKPGQSLAIMQKVGIKIKFYADGSAEQTTDRADSSKGLYTEKGKWFVNKKGALCMTWDVENKKKCGRMRRAADSGYELVRKKQTFVFEEVIPGT